MLPPATSTCVRTVNLSPSRFRHRRDVVDFRTDGNGAGRHHDDRSVRQPQLLLPARKRGLKNYRPTRTPGSRCISIDGGLARFDSSGARARAAPTPHGRAARSERAAIEAGGRALKNYLRERAAGAARHDVDRSSAWPANACAGAVDGLMSRGRVAARGEARGGGAATYVGQDLGHAPGPAFAAGPPLHPEGAAGPVVARLVLVVVLVRRHGVCAALATTTAAADRSALCDFFESQTATFGRFSLRSAGRRCKGGVAGPGRLGGAGSSW